MSQFTPSFVAQFAPVRVRFGAGVRHQVREEVARLGCSRALVLSSSGRADAAMEMAEAIGAPGAARAVASACARCFSAASRSTRRARGPRQCRE